MPPYVHVLLTFAVVIAAGFSNHNPNLRGESLRCYEEGAVMHVPGISSDPCITCKCKNSVVSCRRDTCPLPRGCYFLQPGQGNKCCDVCKKCVYKGRLFSSPYEWSDDEDPCRTFTCNSGVVTESRIYCHVNCKKPLPPRKGQCCPSCEGCVVGNKEYVEGDIVPSGEHDPCIVCVCKEGGVTCSKKSCPVLPCPHSARAQTPGSCCPECRSSKKLPDRKGRCTIGQELFDDASTWLYDQCTMCECQNGTTVCHRTVCPPLQCPPEHQVPVPGSCCSECRRPEEKRAVCNYGGRMYYNGDTWKLNKCTQCSCHHGVVRCGVEECIATPVCPPRKKLITQPGKCCPTCVEEDGVCTVFGDPHYKTFDGKIFNYQGQCRYILTSDCVDNTFSIEVWNDPRYSKSFAWTKSVLISVNDMKIKLGQFLRVRIKKKRVKLPFLQLGVLSIIQSGHSVVVRINKASSTIKVVWDGDNYVEVSVPPTYKNKLCGLCGNYNDRQDDDFVSRNGTRLMDPNAFGNSWLIGRRKKCLKPVNQVSHPLDCRLKDWNLRMQNLQLCNYIKSDTFSACHKVVDATQYFRSCMLDMCECQPSDKCYCDSLNAYAKQCARAGVQIDWMNATSCEGMHCPRGSYYVTCWPPCRKTCKNYQRRRPCRRKCQAGCQCNPGYVWHRDRCILPNECPPS